MIENARTGEQVEFIAGSPEVLTMVTTWTGPGHRATEHVHPGMEERFEVLEGRAAFRIDGVVVEAAAGSVVVVPRGRRHLAWNPTGEPVRLRIEMSPDLRWREFTTRFFAGEDPIRLLDEFAPEVALPVDGTPTDRIPRAWQTHRWSRRPAATQDRPRRASTQGGQVELAVLRLEDRSWFLSFHCLKKYVQVTWFRGTSLRPVPEGTSRTPETRYLNIDEGALDEEQFVSWVRQASQLPGERI